MASDEQTPLLGRSTSSSQAAKIPNDVHAQFCLLAGIPPSDLPKDAFWPKPSRTSIYQRAKSRESSQNTIYLFTATLTNSLLLMQIVISAVLTALGASGSPNTLIYVAVFGAINTVIAGLVTYLKSRGQPMRARMFRDDLERVIDEVENSETMWLGIARQMHGYSAIDVKDKVSVRGEVARLTRLYNEAVRNNTNNNPDLYLNQSGPDDTSGLRSKASAAPTPAPAPVPNSSPASAPPPASAPSAAPAPAKEDSPATSDDKAPDADNKASTAPADTTKSTDPAPATEPAQTNGQAKAPQPSPQIQTPPMTPATPAPATAPAAPAASVPQASTSLIDDVDEGPVTADIPPQESPEAKTDSAAKK